MSNWLPSKWTGPLPEGCCPCRGVVNAIVSCDKTCAGQGFCKPCLRYRLDIPYDREFEKKFYA